MSFRRRGQRAAAGRCTRRLNRNSCAACTQIYHASTLRQGIDVGDCSCLVTEEKRATRSGLKCSALVAGQAVVQMAISKRTRSEYAIKFFLSREAFNEESGLYSQGKHAKSGTFAQFLPRVCLS